MQLSRPYRITVAALGLMILGFMMWYFSTVVFYILGAAVFAIMGKPIVHLVERLKIRTWQPPRWLAALIALLTLMVIVATLISTMMPVVIEKIQMVANYNISDLSEMLRQPIANIENHINAQFPTANLSIKEAINEKLQPLVQSDFISNTVGTIANLAIDISMAVFCISFITYFFLKDENMFANWVTMLFPSKYEANVQRALDSVSNLLIRYFIGISIESFIKLVLIAIPLYFVGFELDTALIIGLIAAILNVIPYVGPIIGAIIGFAIAAITPIPGATLINTIMIMGLVFLVFQLIDNIILQPYIYASSVKAHPLEIFMVILMAGYMAGITGMLFAIPAYTVIRVFAKEFFSNLKVVQRLTDSI